MNKDLVIGIDSSTSECKAILWSADGRLIAEGRAEIPLLRPRPTWHEQPADSWWQAACEAISGAVSTVDAARVAAISISHQRETFVPLDERGQPLRNAIVWMDERARLLLPDLERQYGAERFHQITGKVLSGNLTVSKMAWLKENEPDLFERTDKFADVQAYLVHRLTGDLHTGWGSADPMGLFDMGQNQWSAEILDGLGLTADHLPAAFRPGEVIGQITPEAAECCGLPPGTPVAAGLGDGQSAGLGINITHPGESYLSLGTSTIGGAFSEEYVTSRAFRTMYGGVPGTYLLETVLLSGGYTIKWFVENFIDQQAGAGRSIEAVMEEAASEIAPGSEGLLLVPYWNSAMNPYWDAGASGIMVGWRGTHQRAHMYRAILEGIAFEQRLHLSGIEEALNRKIDRYVAVGGGARSDLWCQIIADVTGKPVYRTRTREATALGAGILAGYAAGWYPDVPQTAGAMVHHEERFFAPDGERYEIYSRLYEEVYRHLYPSLQAQLSRLADLTLRTED
ncbi:MAG: FGGY-family carbohydrate kinase [Anaerolineae bacterium]|nr:FGGY-family carbohydrate kinase [Anaerolineae bacterium]